MNTSVFENYESNVRSYCRSFPTVFTTAKGAVMTDENGKDYIDFFAGAGALNYGHNPDYMIQKLVSYLQSNGIVHSMDMYTVPKRDFLEYFQSKILAPRGLNYKIQFAGPTGTNAVESAIKLARRVKGRENIFALMGAFHGMTLGSLSLTTDRCSRDGAGQCLGNVTHVPAPDLVPGLDTIAYMEMLLTDDHSGVEKPAAIVIETVQADGGINVFPVQWLKDLRALCDKHDILLITDDIQVGCGRTGTFFSFERADIVPDIVTVSKSIGGCGMPLAMVLFKPELDIWEPGQHTGTFRGNQLSLIAGKAGLEYMMENNLLSDVKRKEKIVNDFIKNEILPMDSRISCRGIGLIWGLDFSAFDADMTKSLIAACFKNGLIVERVGRDNNVLKLMPPLTIEDELLVKGLAIVKASLAEIL
ncbi:MAG: diaminobutyrate--2-oxoglutarate transaminase [Oscillospiraceae bacterium]|nr:diaminobutyrate--2-oxoglutarate transaminase [Oscillospiraceae bacterium]